MNEGKLLLAETIIFIMQWWATTTQDTELDGTKFMNMFSLVAWLGWGNTTTYQVSGWGGSRLNGIWNLTTDPVLNQQ